MMVVIDCNLENVLQDYGGGSVWTLPQDVRKFGMVSEKRGKSGRPEGGRLLPPFSPCPRTRRHSSPPELALTQEYGFTNLVIQIESPGMNKAKLLAYLEKIDQALACDTVLYIYGSAASILLDQPGRTSLEHDMRLWRDRHE